MAQLTAPVATSGGSIAGRVDGDVEAFLGVPFGASCAGDGRWRAPADAGSWMGTREAAAFGPDPVQVQKPDPRRRSPGVSEDCLTLNIWRPRARTGDPLPVMVWFDVGSFLTASGASARVDGAALARRGVVLVTFNSRVNVFGYLAHPALSAESEHRASGNYGLLDQLAALQWVRANIGAFGGDATRVTAFGLSAGGASIALLLTSPLAVGLFDRAILHSPGTGRPLCSLSEAEAAGSALGTDLAALRALPAADVLAQIPKVAPPVRGLTTPRVLRPIHDGYVVPKQETEAFDRGEFAHVPMILGNTSDEGSWALGDVPIHTVADYRAYMRQNFGDAVDDALTLYPAKTDAEVRVRLAEVFGETQFTYGVRSLARASARYQPKTFRYLFRKSAAGHNDDIQCVFGNLPDDATDLDRSISELEMTAWVRFAATGDPNGPGVPPWPQFDAAADTYFEIGEHPGVHDHWRSEQLDFIDRYLRSPSKRAPA